MQTLTKRTNKLQFFFTLLNCEHLSLCPGLLEVHRASELELRRPARCGGSDARCAEACERHDDRRTDEWFHGMRSQPDWVTFRSGFLPLQPTVHVYPAVLDFQTP